MKVTYTGDNLRLLLSFALIQQRLALKLNNKQLSKLCKKSVQQMINIMHGRASISAVMTALECISTYEIDYLGAIEQPYKVTIEGIS